jgi:hypothetical protein
VVRIVGPGRNVPGDHSTGRCSCSCDEDRRLAESYRYGCERTEAKNLADQYQLPTIDWDDVRRTLENQLTQAPATGGPDHHTFWLSTLDVDGRPHVTAVGAFWVDGRYYFCGGPRTRKIRNTERDPRCAFGVGLEGRASG